MESSKASDTANYSKSEDESSADGDQVEVDRQPLVPVQSSKKRRRSRASLDDDRDNIENKKPRSEGHNLDDIVISSDEDDIVLGLGSPPSIGNALSPWDIDDDNGTGKPEHCTPHSNRRDNGNRSKLGRGPGNVSCYVSPSADVRPCPLPQLPHADPKSVWKTMCQSDGRNLLYRIPKMLDRHPGILKRMRAILLDWLIEVCEVYKLHRETYYLAFDYLDRYLSCTQNMCKTQLQLIGITCLFIAAKMEEIYPPKISDFAYVTDGACDEQDILMQELTILQMLEWRVNTITAIGWLGVYLQVEVPHKRNFRDLPSAMSRRPDLETPDKSPVAIPKGSTDSGSCGKSIEAFLYPQFSGCEFTQVSQLMDLCSLDVEICNFPYSVIAAAAIYHVKDRKTALSVSGLDWESIAECVTWMEPFYSVILEDGSPLQLLEQNEQVVQNYGLRSVCPNLTKDDSYKIQVHTCTLDMFDKAIERREEDAESRFRLTGSTATAICSANLVMSPMGMLTPPASNRKSLDAAGLTVSESKDSHTT